MIVSAGEVDKVIKDFNRVKENIIRKLVENPTDIKWWGLTFCVFGVMVLVGLVLFLFKILVTLRKFRIRLAKRILRESQ